MYFFYVDESGSLDPTVEGERADGSRFTKPHLYVLTAVSLFEKRWHGFDKTLTRKKRSLIKAIRQRTYPHSINLDLADCEVKSTAVRIAKQRANRPFLANLTNHELHELVELFYEQLNHHYMRVFSVVVDKRHLHGYMDSSKMRRKAWELLLEMVQLFLREEHSKHQGVLITDDVSKQSNRSLAMKHAYIQSEGTASGLWLTQIAEMPLFVRSELSNGVQLADLLAYNVMRCFRDEDPDYSHFSRIIPHLWASSKTGDKLLDGLRVFPSESPLTELVEAIAKKKGQPNG